MANLDLTKYGITGATEIVHNPSYEMLFEEETKPELTGYEKGQVTELGAVNVMTGVYTGRSPKDKYIVVDENSKDTVWWTSDEYKNDNHPMTEQTWSVVKDIAKKELCNKRLFVVDAFCGANKDTRMAIRFIVEVAWQAHFVTNMFIKPTAEELANFEPDFVVYNASKAKVENYKELGLNSETCVAFNITSKEQVIINTWYGGEMKKGMFSDVLGAHLTGMKAYMLQPLVEQDLPHTLLLRNVERAILGDRKPEPAINIAECEASRPAARRGQGSAPRRFGQGAQRGVEGASRETGRESL